MIRASAAARAPASSARTLWVAGGAISSGAFTDATEEAAAVALVAAGYTVTRQSSSSVTVQPLRSDCNVYVILAGAAGGDTAARATATNAAPILCANGYALANSFGSLAVASGSTSGGSSTAIGINATSPPTWTDGWTNSSTVTVLGSSTYYERVGSGWMTGAVNWADDATGNVGYIIPSGNNNLAGVALTARIATWNMFALGVTRLTGDGQQIFDDLITWLMA